MRIAIELIPDVEEGGYTARLPDVPAYGEGEGLDDVVARLSTPEVRHVEWDLAELASG